jgi:predicted amidohydrolase
LYRDASGHDSFRDEEVIRAGSELTLLELGDVRLGILIGFDAEFPEAFRTLALRGADLIVVALNQLAADTAYLGAMAARNRVPVLVANRIGFRKMYPGVPEFSAMAMPLVQDKDGSFLARCRGASVIFDASGHVLDEPSQAVQRDLERIAGAPQAAIIPLAHFQQDEVLNASFRIDELRVQRLTSPYIAQRRPELYAGIAAAPVSEPSPITSEPAAAPKPKKPRAPRKRKTPQAQ